MRTQQRAPWRRCPTCGRYWPAFCFAVVLLCPGIPGRAAEEPADTLQKAAAAFSHGQREEAFDLVNRAITADPSNARLYFVRGRFHGSAGDPGRAIQDFSEVIRLDPRASLAWQLRALERFKLGQVEGALADLNRYVELVPQKEAELWQRGILFYCTARYAEGQRQFELHRKINPDDVENAIWHFLCVARQKGVEQARAGLLQAPGDRRVPMSEIHALFAGTGSEQAVVDAAMAPGTDPEQFIRRLFYAHLYLGLHAEAVGDLPKANGHLELAARKYRVEDFMGDLAPVCAERVRKRLDEVNSSGKVPR